MADPTSGSVPVGTGFHAGQTWRSSKTWWRIRAVFGGKVLVEGPRGCTRSSRDGGQTWGEFQTSMTLPGFAAWVRKTGATADV